MLAQPNPKTLSDVKKWAVRGGEWVSIATELRPTEDRTGGGKINSFYVSRSFKFFEGDRFEGTIISSADAYGTMPLVKFTFKGHTIWGKQHPIAEGAYEIDYILDEGFEVTPLHPMFAEQLNMAPVNGLRSWQVNVTQDIKGKAFPLFNIKEGQIVGDYDLIYFNNGMLFMGAKHVDGRGFDKPENRPTNLQIPLIRKK
ncbi:MAG: hypothetical protein KA247_07180 [Bacteroidetes bacterium]|nr:hypothetical protein [Bacteroidota bacterium]